VAIFCTPGKPKALRSDVHWNVTITSEPRVGLHWSISSSENVPGTQPLSRPVRQGCTAPSGRAALVMANSASDARHSEADIRRTLIQQNLIYGILTLP
jgi:hypothetical protein